MQGTVRLPDHLRRFPQRVRREKTKASQRPRITSFRTSSSSPSRCPSSGAGQVRVWAAAQQLARAGTTAAVGGGHARREGDPIPDPGPVDPHGHHRRANIERLRITNNGLHDVKVKFRLKRPVDDDGNELEEPGDLPIPGVDVFKFEPEEMTLFAEETHELIVTAYPKGEHEWPPEPEPEPEGEAEAAPAEVKAPADGEAPAEGEPPADGEAAEGEPEPQDGDTEKATAKNVQVSAFPRARARSRSTTASSSPKSRTTRASLSFPCPASASPPRLLCPWT